MTVPLVTIAVPSLNQGAYLDKALESIFAQDLPLEVILVDGGSTDNSRQIIQRWEKRLSWWRSGPDRGQSTSINEAIAMGSAPYVCWLNSDDRLCADGLSILIRELESNPQAPCAYGRCWTITARGRRVFPYPTLPFSTWLLRRYCPIAQPATLIRRSAWTAVTGLDVTLDMAFDYDLWWRLYLKFGAFSRAPQFVAETRSHRQAKTTINRRLHYREAMGVVRRHTGSVPLKWYVAWPFMVNLRQMLSGRRPLHT